MGIPKFYTRIHAYGANEIIGRRSSNSGSQGRSQNESHSRSQSQSAIAIVDGPSLAHFLFDELMKAGDANKRAECFYRYDTIGELAVQWLDELCSFGFEMRYVFFDGALLAYKRQTRINRLQKYAENLTKYKQHARYAEDSLLSTYDPTQAYCYRSAKRMDREALIRARKSLPPPPFLVAAVIEALTDSRYAPNTWVVDGEADEFCVAAACEIRLKFQQENIDTPVHVFTNDSDLLIWPMPQGTHITITREMEKTTSGLDDVLTAHCFEPNLISRSSGYTENDLIRPAFNMRNPKVTFAQALKGSVMEYDGTAFTAFAAQHDEYYAWVKLSHQRYERERKIGDLQLHEPRVSELLRQYFSGLLRNRTITEDLGGTLGFDKLDAISDAVTYLQERKGGAENDDNQQFVSRMAIWEAAQIELEPANPFCCEAGPAKPHHKKRPTSKPPMRLEMFLPVLLEDPERSTAWRAGMALRDMAEALIMLPFKNHESTLLEYRRAGSSVAARSINRASIDHISQNMAACLRYFRKALDVVNKLDPNSQWRFLVMQLTLSDRDRMEKEQSSPKETSVRETLSIVNGKASSGWRIIHFFAQYQAVYFSLRMLREIIGFCKDRTEFQKLGLPQTLLDCGEMLKGLPAIRQFFATDDPDIDVRNWEALSGEFETSFEAND